VPQTAASGARKIKAKLYYPERAVVSLLAQNYSLVASILLSTFLGYNQEVRLSYLSVRNCPKIAQMVVVSTQGGGFLQRILQR
jgi:hypothetical protein